MPVCLLGLPGCGKSTLFRELEKSLGLPGMHPGRHAVKAGLVTNSHPSRADLLAVEAALTPSFLQAVADALAVGDVLIDGFPRTEKQAGELVKKGWNLKVIHLVFPAGREMELSVERQVKRVREDGLTPNFAELTEQCQLGLLHDEIAVSRLKALGVEIITVDAMLAPTEVLSLVLAGLNLSLAAPT